MIENILSQAKYKFLKDYFSKISELGCDLSAGIVGFSKNSKNLDSIEARIRSENDVPETLKIQIERIIPEAHTYKNEKIRVKVAYTNIPNLY